MRSVINAAWLLGLALTGCVWAGPVFYFHVVGDDPGPWPRILSAIGLTSGAEQGCTVYVVRAGTPANEVAWDARVEQGAILILEGESPVAEAFGFKAGQRRVPVRNVMDERAATLPIIWERAADTPVFSLPSAAKVFAKERWQNLPLLAGYRKGQGAVLWLAASPGEQGYERFPYLPQTLVELGLELPFRSARLWAFFDASYRRRVDLDYFAERWQKAGIAALHVAAWHFYEPDQDNDAYLQRLIEACHRRGILVYAWLELPHVSEKFWQDHPEWREQTALQQDAHLDWRKLMNLINRDCFREVSRGVRRLLDRADWDGVNLAELYFESLEGAANPARFTPLNHDVRAQFQQAHGFDPQTLFAPGVPADNTRLQAFLDFRAGLARRMQEDWMAELRALQRQKPHLEVILTHVDDRYDTRMRELIGADAARVLPMLDQQEFTFLVEDPATIWHLGPDRYPQIAAKYQPLTRRPEKLAIDINVVERYQDVYPTKQQTGTELFSLVHLAAKSFPRVALYFENSLHPVDLDLLPTAAAAVTRVERVNGKLVVESPYGVGVPWKGDALLDGRVWPVGDSNTVWIPSGAHALAPGNSPPPIRLLRLNADLRTATAMPSGIEFTYQSQGRALAIVDKKPARVQVDGVDTPIRVLETPSSYCLLLPRGQHIVYIHSLTNN